MFTLAALVLSLTPAPVIARSTAGQAKVQIIKGNNKKGARPLTAPSSEVPAAAPADQQATAEQAAKSAALSKQAADQDLRQRDLDAREQAVQEKETAAADAEAKKAERQRALQRKIQQMGEQNQKAWQDANNALVGD